MDLAIGKGMNVTNTKRFLSTETSQYIKKDSRGIAVAIGPLEYCGNGIALMPTNGSIVSGIGQWK